ncbi:MAG: methyltransferase domain-containing protein [Anaerolineales bacterium]|nr:methyltransferase domain-containing protein [Anaerolineales bacterium]
MEEYLVHMLICPNCHGELDWTIHEQQGNRIERAEASCRDCNNTYPIRDGIAVFLTTVDPDEDLWESMEGHLSSYFKEHPEVEQQLLEMPLESLNPADRYFRAELLEKQGLFSEAAAAEEAANADLYTEGYLEGQRTQFQRLLKELPSGTDPILDIASGRCALVRKLAEKESRPIIASDLSPHVLHRDRQWLESLGLETQVSLLAFDIRFTPFREKSLSIITTNLGLPNIMSPGELLNELNRILDGTFLAITHFYPENDPAHAKLIKEYGLDTFIYQGHAVRAFEENGFNVELAGTMVCQALPTPRSELIPDAAIDAFPLAEVELTWSVLIASNN